MELEDIELDVDKYYQWIKGLGQDFRLLADIRSNPDKWPLSVLKSIDLDSIVENERRYLSGIPSKLGIEYWIPTMEEVDVIDYSRGKNLEYDIDSIEKIGKRSALSVRVLRDIKVKESEYFFVNEYRLGVPISIVELNRKSIIIKFIADLSVYDFVSHVSQESMIDYKIKESVGSYEGVFVTEDHKNTFLDTVKKINYVYQDGKLNVCYGSKNALLRSFVEAIRAKDYARYGITEKAVFSELCSLFGVVGNYPKRLTKAGEAALSRICENLPVIK